MRALADTPILRSDTPSGMPTLTGHFAVWNTWTTIHERGYTFLERLSPTSMTKTLSEGKDRIRCLYDHGRDPTIGNKPLGKFSRIEPDERGAYYEVPLLDTSYNHDLIPALREGLLGASFRFEVMNEEYVERPARSDYNPLGIPERTITEARVMEAGPVTFPAYADATAGLRSMTDRFALKEFLADPEGLRELLEQERSLRRPRVTVTYGRNPENATSTTYLVERTLDTPSNESATAEVREADLEPEPSEATTPPTVVEPEPSEATTREQPGEPRLINTREEWLQRCRTRS